MVWTPKTSTQQYILLSMHDLGYLKRTLCTLKPPELFLRNTWKVTHRPWQITIFPSPSHLQHKP